MDKTRIHFPIILLLLLVVAAVSFSFPAGDELFFERPTIKDGLSNNSVLIGNLISPGIKKTRKSGA